MARHIELLQTAVDKVLKDKPDLSILEAGCGSMSFLNLEAATKITGIDISEKQLARNELLDERICGDISTHSFEPGTFDSIICFDVLEHVEFPVRAMENLMTSLAPGGIMILKFPNLWSIKGLITKLTPHWFHVWVYRVIYKYPNAGKNDTAPFPTYLKKEIGPPAVRSRLREKGLIMVYEGFYESNYQINFRKKNPVLAFAFKTIGILTRLFSLGKISFENTEYIIVVQQPCD